MAISASAAAATAVAVTSSLFSPSLRYRAMDALLRLRNNPGILDSSSRGGARFCLLGPTVEETTLSLSNQSLRYLPIVLEGRFKGVWGPKQHRFTLAATGDTKALANQKWLRRMVRARGAGGAGPMAGPLFCRRQDHPTPIRVAELDKLFHRYLLVVPEESPELIGPNVDVEQDYSSWRSIRRGATTRVESLDPGGGGRCQQPLEKGRAGWKPRPKPGDAAGLHGCGGICAIEYSVLDVPLSPAENGLLPFDAGLVSTGRGCEVCLKDYRYKGGIACLLSGGLGPGALSIWQSISVLDPTGLL
jgi:hypothetical protein